MKYIKSKLFIIILFIIFPICIFCSLFFGAEKISFQNFFKALFLNDNSLTFFRTILIYIRLPRTILVFISGLLLGGTGAVLQGFFRNSLSDSSVLGLSSGAAFGGAVGNIISSSVSFFSIGIVSLFSFFGSIFCALLLLLFTDKNRKQTSITNLLLTGTALSALFSSGASILFLINSKELHKMFVWTLGSFNGKGIPEIKFILLPSLVAIILLLFVSRFLDLLTSGVPYAMSLGLNLKTLTVLTLFATSLATASSVCAGGIIGFVGLISPFIVRNFCQINHRRLIPFSMLTGSIILLLSDTLARVIIAPAEMPIGIITSIIGAPIFIKILSSNVQEKFND